jgi:hypothetical protein
MKKINKLAKKRGYKTVKMSDGSLMITKYPKKYRYDESDISTFCAYSEEDERRPIFTNDDNGRIFYYFNKTTLAVHRGVINTNDPSTYEESGQTSSLYRTRESCEKALAKYLERGSL